MLNKNEFINLIVEDNEVSKKTAHEMVDMVLNGIAKAMVDYEGVAFAGFGQFYVKEVEAGTKRNPSTGESIEIPKHGQAKFKFGKTVKDAVR